MFAALLTTFADTLVSAAESAPEAESSKTAFYILGGTAAAWALILFAVGMRSETFPRTAGVQRGVIAISVLVVIGAMAGAVLTA
jgi:hypothetical protein